MQCRMLAGWAGHPTRVAANSIAQSMPARFPVAGACMNNLGEREFGGRLGRAEYMRFQFISRYAVLGIAFRLLLSEMA